PGGGGAGPAYPVSRGCAHGARPPGVSQYGAPARRGAPGRRSGAAGPLVRRGGTSACSPHHGGPSTLPPDSPSCRRSRPAGQRRAYPGGSPGSGRAAAEEGEQMASRRISLGMPTPRRTDETTTELPDTSQRPDTPALADRFGREATDLRLSLTDFCNLRCTYCMPASGLTFLGKEQLLSVDEVVRLVRIGVERLDISLTTNAIGLDHRAARLRAAGLDRINVSLDSVVSETFERLSRRPLLHRVLAGIDGARTAGLDPIKINAVLLPGVNDQELPD